MLKVITSFISLLLSFFAKNESKRLINEVMTFSNHYDICDDKIFKLKSIAENILSEASLPATNRGKIEPKMTAVRAYMGKENEAKPLASVLGLASEIAISDARPRTEASGLASFSLPIYALTAVILGSIFPLFVAGREASDNIFSAILFNLKILSSQIS